MFVVYCDKAVTLYSEVSFNEWGFPGVIANYLIDQNYAEAHFSN